MKRKISYLLIFALFLQIIAIYTPVEATNITAESAIVIDHNTGEILYEKNPDASMVPASLTKIMTAYIIFEEIEAGNLTKDSMIKVSKEAAKMSRNNSYPMAVPLQEGASYSVHKLLELIMIPSASASCYTVAEHISGSEQKFVQRMNKIAKDMGITANFKNSHGAKPHYTTARSMAILVSRFINEYPNILDYTSLQSITFRGKTYKTYNRLITPDTYTGVDGFKTGTIKEAGYCLATTAKRNGRRVISVVLKSSSNANRYNDSKKILDIGFAKQAQLNSSRENTVIEFKNLPEEVRLNLDFKVDVKLSGISDSYLSKIVWTIDDKPYKTINNVNINNGIISLNGHTTDVKDKLNIGFFLEDFKGDRKGLSTYIDISKDEPVLYRDVEGSNIEYILRDLSDKEILNGVENGYFGIGRNVGRGDFVTGLGRTLEYLGMEVIHNEESSFSDVKYNDYYNKYVSWGNMNNIIKGYNNRFSPNNSITNEEAAVIVDRLLNFYGLGGIKKDLVIEDLSEISYWANSSVQRVLNLKIMNLSDSSNFNPNKNLNREEFAEIIFNLMEVLQNINTEINSEAV